MKRRHHKLTGPVKWTGLPRGGVAVGAAVMLSVSILLGPVGAASAGQEPIYVNEDAVLNARQIHSFSVGTENVSVLLGDFSLRLGRRVVTGADAVIWIKQRRRGERSVRDIEVYVEGQAKVTEPDGTATTDRVMFVVFRQQGHLRARVALATDRKLESFPLYQRAVAVRRRIAAGAGPAPGPPELVAPSTTTRPGDMTSTPTASAPTVPQPAPRRHQPVSFRADKFTSEELPDPADPAIKRRVTIARGNVYFSQGNPDGDLFLEIRSDEAVLYTLPEGAGEGLAPERIQGAYLEGDVVMRRGERTIRGTQLFYDFVAGRAIILQPVLRTVQEQRDIPVYIRGREGRQLAAHEEPGQRPRTRGYRWHFRDAIVTTSDFYTPTYHIAARRVYLEDTTPYDEQGVALDEPSWRTKSVNSTFNIRSIPVLWAPVVVGDAREGHTALRRAQIGRHGRFGWGGETEWFLFRLLGIPRPEGFKGRLEANWHERGVLGGVRIGYTRENYTGYALAYGLLDRAGQDDFGTQRENIDARQQRGRALFRHKHFLPRDWVVQVETAYLSDRNFLEAFFPQEFWAEKPNESLVYAKKQRDNWALTALAQWRLNDFLTETESYPDVAAYLVGESLWQDRLTLYSEGRIGIVRYRPDHDLAMAGSHATFRADTRHEIDMPLNVGPVRVRPYVAGRLTYWGNDVNGSAEFRPWGQVGFNAATHIWRVYDGVQSRLWDLNRLKHIITPYGGVFLTVSDVEPNQLYPFTPDVETYVSDASGGTLGVRQLWQTKRGPADRQQIVDWLRMDLSVSLFTDEDINLPADGRYFMHRPEHSLARNAVNWDMAWNVSDSTTFLADANFDIDSGQFGRANAGLVVVRDPRLRYFVGCRYIEPLDSTVGTLGFTYKINRKYSVSLFEQYDFTLDDGQNLTTTATVLRKFPRWYMGFTVVYDRSAQDIGFMLTLWPEGIPEATIGGRRLSLMLAAPDRD